MGGLGGEAQVVDPNEQVSSFGESLCTGRDCSLTGLQPYSGPLQGRMEVRHDGVWGTICSHKWTFYDADYACKYLGFPGAYANAMAVDAWYGEGTGPIWLSELECNAESGDIFHCPHAGWNPQSGCTHANDAGVVCEPKPKPKCATKGQPSPSSLPGGGAAAAGSASAGQASAAAAGNSNVVENPVPTPIPTPSAFTAPTTSKRLLRARNRARRSRV